MADRDLLQLLDDTDKIESLIRDLQCDLNYKRRKMIEHVVNEGWLHCLSLNKAMVRRTIHKMN